MRTPITNYYNLKTNFYKEHPRVEKRSWEEIDKFLNLHQIKFSGFDYPKPIFSLDEINFPSYIYDEIKLQGIHKPSAIQSLTWPALYSGRDLMCIGLPTASRVLSYICPALVFVKEQPMEIRKAGPLVLIVTQTKEVAKEILTQSQMFIHQSHCSFICLFDDENMNTQSMHLREREFDIIIGNYHRLCELLDNDLINLKNVSFLIMDDFYRNRSARLSDEIKRVVNETRTDRQTAIFSRIVPSGLQKSNGDEFQNDALFVCIGNDDIHVPNRDLPQQIHVCTMAEKRKKLQDIISEIVQQEKNFKILVYANGFKKIRITEKIIKELRIDTFAYERTSVGRRRRAMKEKIYYNFNATPNSVLVASDVVSSKVDLPDLNYIINADFPVNLSLYLNRMRMPNIKKYISIFIAEDARHADRLIYVLNECRQLAPSILYKISEAYINSGKDVDRMPSLSEINDGITKPVEKPIPKPLPPTVSHSEVTISPTKRVNQESETPVNETNDIELNTNLDSSMLTQQSSTSSMSPNETMSSSSSNSSLNINLNKNISQRSNSLTSNLNYKRAKTVHQIQTIQQQRINQSQYQNNFSSYSAQSKYVQSYQNQNYIYPTHLQQTYAPAYYQNTQPYYQTYQTHPVYTQFNYNQYQQLNNQQYLYQQSGSTNENNSTNETTLLSVKNEPIEHTNDEANMSNNNQNWSPYFTNPIPFKQEPSEPVVNNNNNEDKNALNIVNHLLKDKQILNQLEKVAQTFRLSN